MLSPTIKLAHTLLGVVSSLVVSYIRRCSTSHFEDLAAAGSIFSRLLSAIDLRRKVSTIIHLELHDVISRINHEDERRPIRYASEKVITQLVIHIQAKSIEGHASIYQHLALEGRRGWYADGQC